MKTKQLVSRVSLRLNMRDKGVRVLPKSHTPTGIICSFSAPPPTMKKYKKLSLIFKNRRELFSSLISSFNFQRTRVKDTWYSTDLDQYISDNSILLNRRYKHHEYEFTSVMLDEPTYRKLLKISRYYEISRSSLIRILIDAFEENE